MHSYRVLGLMAGSSADGVSAALVRFWKSSSWQYELLEAHTFPYPEMLQKELLGALTLPQQETLRLSTYYTDWTAELIQAHFGTRYYDLISWHPHNLYHEPEIGLTWSLGDGERLRVQVSAPVVYHFRARDIASGGKGAPLIPIADGLLFSSYETLINLGGIANLTHLPSFTAYDITPCNQVLNALARQAGSTTGYDPQGSLAAQGKVLPALLEQLQQHPFFTLSPPKALSNRTVREAFLQPLLSYDAFPCDKLRTAVELITWALERALRTVAARRFTLTGGGTYNTFLIQRLQERIPELTYHPAPPELIEYREAIGFALLGLLRWLREDNILPFWTGAHRAHSSGLISL
ncbi:MAG: anhydro-N-acetylmuramic acid kinase [Bacteroidia bacterium]|nr:anhydro-N-acetylmuramic acid kinase [Bacteroidia bacterium]MDW8235710.1 anhydro-N-acetylmuramic acid kinase [Bacteroidia bacterium]